MLKCLNKVSFSKNYKKFTTTSIKKFSEYNFEIFLPNLQKLKVQIDGEKSLAILESEIKKDDKFRTVEFRTWDNSEISKNNYIDSVFRNVNPIFVRVNTMEWQLLNSRDFNFTTTEKYKIKQDFSPDPNIQLKEIKLQLEKFNQNKELTDNEINQMSISLYKIKNLYSNFDSAKTTTKFKNMEEIFEQFYDLKAEYTKLYEMKEKLMSNCQFKAKLLILIAGLLFIIELIFIYWGTFIKYSWDIIEPVTYLMTCTNLILILFLKRRMGNFTPLEFYTQKYFKKLVNKKKFDEFHFNEINFRLKEIEIILNK